MHYFHRVMTCTGSVLLVIRWVHTSALKIHLSSSVLEMHLKCTQLFAKKWRSH